MLVANYSAGHRHCRSLLVCLLASLLLGAPPAGSFASEALPRIAPGVYEGMLLATDGSGALTGYFRQSIGNATCSFFVKGQARGPLPIKISTWGTAVYPGTLEPKGADAVQMKIESGEHPGCGNVLGSSIDDGLAFSRTLAAKWIGLKVVRSERAYFHSEASKETRRKAYVVKGNVLAVLVAKGDWIEAEFYNHDSPAKTTKGWVPLSDLADPTPPR